MDPFRQMMVEKFKRQLEIAEAIAEGSTARQAASEFGISPRTAEEHIIRLRDVFNAKTTPHLISILYRMKFLK